MFAALLILAFGLAVASKRDDEIPAGGSGGGYNTPPPLPGIGDDHTSTILDLVAHARASFVPRFKREAAQAARQYLGDSVGAAALEAEAATLEGLGANEYAMGVAGYIKTDPQDWYPVSWDAAFREGELDAGNM